MLRYAAPLIPNSICWWIINLSDRLIIIHFLGYDANGIYAVANKLAQVITLGYGVFDKAWMVSAVSSYHSAQRDVFFTTVFHKLASLLFLMVGGLVILMKPIMSLWVAEAYFAAWQYSAILVVAMVFHCFSTFYGVGYNCSKKTTLAFYTTIIAAVTNVVVNLLFVRMWGLYAAAVSTLLAYAVLWFARLKSTAVFFNIKLDLQHLFINSGIIMIALIINYLNQPFVWVISTILICALLYVNRHLLLETYQSGVKSFLRSVR